MIVQGCKKKILMEIRRKIVESAKKRAHRAHPGSVELHQSQLCWFNRSI